jgi:multiple sugar transport system substrate-binding protein
MKDSNSVQRRNLASLSRRDFLQIAAISGGAAFLAACGVSPVQQEPTPQNAGLATTLTFWTPGGSQAWCPDAITKSMEAFTKANPSITFNEVQCGTGEQNFQEALLARIAAGNPPDAAALYVSPIALGARGALVALDKMLPSSKYAQVENWPTGVIASCQFNGKTWGLPVTIDSYGMWYNQEWFEKKGIPAEPKDFPKTWDELRKLSKEFTRWNGDKLETAGFVPWRDARELPIWSALNGGQIYDAVNQKYMIDSEINIALMEYGLAWLEEEYKGDINKVNASGYWGAYPGPQGQPPAFQEGQLAMMINGSWIMGDFYASVEPKFTKWNVAPLPIGPMGSKTVSGYWPTWVAILQGSKHVQEAFQWLDYISGEGVKIWFAASPNLPANKKVPRDLIPALLVEKRGEAFARQVMDFFLNQLSIATPMWDSPIQSFAEDQLWRAIDRIAAKTAKPRDVLAEAQKACQTELENTLKGIS